MNPGDFILRLLFLVQTGIGVVGNSFLLSIYAPTSCTGRVPRPTHLILTHMAVANFLVLLFKGIPHMMLIWGITPTLGNAGCKLVYYIHRVARGLSLCTTCLLSNFQAITISPRPGGMIGLNHQAWKSISFSCVLCWIFNLLMNIFIPINMEGLQHGHNSTKLLDYGLCSSRDSETSTIRYTFLMTLADVVFLALMAGASAYMVLLLHTHQQTVKHIYSTNKSHRFSPETKATQTILILASTFIVFYLTNSFLTIYSTLILKSRLWLQHTNAFLAACYSTISPLILMLRDPRTSNCCS
ncbi:vomeronasal 1 receptor cavPorV1R641 [Cavia porcellus]|uniref:vomeronasal 1 receptor cavPorV1R641 n=1 Tax=Cavia porcellus TaxID=10141 RepID=UPI0001CF741E|nr:vomeronasal 1 receptor cavPorV1R641 [Cavia porcellus]